MSGSRKRREEDRSDSAAGPPGSPPSGDLKAENEALKKEITALKERLAERERCEASLKECDEKYRILFQSLDDGIVINDSGGVITEWNPAMEGIFGITKEQAVGHTIHEISSICTP